MYGCDVHALCHGVCVCALGHGIVYVLGYVEVYGAWSVCMVISRRAMSAPDHCYACVGTQKKVDEKPTRKQNCAKHTRNSPVWPCCRRDVCMRWSVALCMLTLCTCCVMCMCAHALVHSIVYTPGEKLIKFVSQTSRTAPCSLMRAHPCLRTHNV